MDNSQSQQVVPQITETEDKKEGNVEVIGENEEAVVEKLKHDAQTVAQELQKDKEELKKAIEEAPAEERKELEQEAKEILSLAENLVKEEKKLEKVESEYKEAINAEQETKKEVAETKVEEQKRPVVEHNKEHIHSKIHDQKDSEINNIVEAFQKPEIVNFGKKEEHHKYQKIPVAEKIVEDVKKETDLDEAEKLYDHLKKHGTLRDVRDAQHLDDRKHLKSPQFSGKYPTASELVKQARKLHDIDKKVPSAHELLERKKKQQKKS